MDGHGLDGVCDHISHSLPHQRNKAVEGMGAGADMLKGPRENIAILGSGHINF